MFDPNVWASVPFHFWSFVVFVFGSIVGSFLNVCIHRMPRGESIVSPPSHCPHCGYSIPWYLNLPLVTWLWLRGKCANCGAPISIRYFLVELLTAILFLCSWLRFGHYSPAVALAYCVLLAGFVVATFIDFEHFIIPDEITIGGMFVGFFLSFLIPKLHGANSLSEAMGRSFLGILVGGGLIYAILRVGKLVFGKQKRPFEADTKILFTETDLHLPNEQLPYGEIYYRDSDAIVFHAKKLETIDRCYWDVDVRLTPKKLQVGSDVLDPEQVLHLEAITDKIVLPREAMGFGDVKFMAAIGAFLGWPAVIFSLMASSVIGSAVGVAMILFRKKEWSSRIPYGPYIAIAATIWVFWRNSILRWFM